MTNLTQDQIVSQFNSAFDCELKYSQNGFWHIVLTSKNGVDGGAGIKIENGKIFVDCNGFGCFDDIPEAQQYILSAQERLGSFSLNDMRQIYTYF